MNISEYKYSFLMVASLLLCLNTSCKKEEVLLYEVNPVYVQQEGGDKTNVKTTVEFISIAYSDVFGTNISNSDLNKLNTAYVSFGDKKLIEDMIIRNFLNDPTAQLPSKQDMLNDVNAFVLNSYKQFYNRTPNEMERFYLQNLIVSDTSVNPSAFYYSFMTSDEYRYY
ncbi:MAG TPA: hypothetical protein PKH65_06960 [Bacteroidia bacterium]|nr:hypothetical protein [Bacteroidia bacterium]HNT80406.1 hypothetical protein [Bacteroidia bacterium]